MPAQFFVDGRGPGKWRYLKGTKSITRISRSTGHRVHLRRRARSPSPTTTTGPSRTILTGEGGATPSRFKHLIQTEDGRYRRLTPRELERLNGFPDDWTAGHVRRQARIHDGQRPGRRPRRASRRRARSTEIATPAASRSAQPPPSRWPDSSCRIRRRSSPAVRKVMRANRARDTGPERRLRQALREAGLGGYRLNWRRRLVGPTSPTPAAGSRSSSTAATGTTARAATRTCRSRTRSSGPASSSSTGSATLASAPMLEAADWTVIEAWECDVRDRLPQVTEAVRRVHG